MRNRDTRNDVVNELPDDIRNTIGRREAERPDVIAILTRCMSFQDGIEMLIDNVRKMEGNSEGMKEVDKLMEERNN